jgi:hypothetical protein
MKSNPYVFLARFGNVTERVERARYRATMSNLFLDLTLNGVPIAPGDGSSRELLGHPIRIKPIGILSFSHSPPLPNLMQYAFLIFISFLHILGNFNS